MIKINKRTIIGTIGEHSLVINDDITSIKDDAEYEIKCEGPTKGKIGEKRVVFVESGYISGKVLKHLLESKARFPKGTKLDDIQNIVLGYVSDNCLKKR